MFSDFVSRFQSGGSTWSIDLDQYHGHVVSSYLYKIFTNYYSTIWVMGMGE